ncbi:class D sortase [Pseudomarimonas arenosa]|uniref:Class D sortase n=1 Tax=Pseudomarimonas arenosa TaxID=2774145 RepID=A0AAW3ZMX9_9GAMM|nr:class D sortase [Pseudomarimonas arenosa]MBD8527431.1 class D sortase [Pseudomarimonas arenosa]
MSARFALRCLEVSAWILGVGLLGFYISARASGEAERREAISEFALRSSFKSAGKFNQPNGHEYQKQAPNSEFEPGPDPNSTLDARQKAQWSIGRIERFESTQSSVSADDGAAVAILSIPRVELEVPVLAQLNERNLNRGAALDSDSAPPHSDGNVVIAAHRDGYFRSLRHVVVGDSLTVELTNRQRSYRVTSISIVAPTDLSPLLSTSVASITLVTCYPFFFVGSAPQRYIVRAEEQL